MCTVKKYVNQSFPYNSKAKGDITKIAAVLKPMKSDYYLVKFWQKLEQLFFGGGGVKGFLNILKTSYALKISPLSTAKRCV